MARRKVRPKTASRSTPGASQSLEPATEAEEPHVATTGRQQDQTGSGFQRWLPVYAAAVLVLPFIVLWHKDNALYSPLWYADPWFYLGYFRDLVGFKRDLFYDYYYGGRLSWILPGFLVHSLFSPVMANAILHLTVQSTATLSFFTILRLTAGARSAFLATMVFAVNPWLWVATGWDYPDGAGIAYCLLAMALLTRSAVHPRRKWTLLAAGAAIAGVVYTHLFLGTLTPLILFYYIGLAWVRRRTPVWRSVVALFCWAGAGFTIVSLVFCGINYLLDGNFWFYASSIRRAQSMSKDFQFAKSIWVNHQLAPWLWPAVAGSVTAVALIPSRIRRVAAGCNGIGLLLSAQLLLAVIYMAYLQNRGTTVLGHYPYTSYLLPFVFLVTGISFWPAAQAMSRRTYAAICGVAAMIFAALWYNPYGFLAPASPASQRVIILGSAFTLAMALVLRQRTTGTLLAVTGFAAFTAVSLAQTVNLDGLDLHGTREQYRRVMHARDRIEAVRKGRTVRFWFDKQEPNFHEYTGLNSLYILEFSQLGTSFPGGCDVPVDPGTLIVVLSQKERTAELARSALADCWRSFGMRPVIEADEMVERRDRPYTMAMLRADASVSTMRDSEKPLQPIDLGRVESAYSKASLKQTPGGLLVTTGPEFGSFAASVALGLKADVEAKLEIHVRARVTKGKVGFGILDSAGRTILLERSLMPSSDEMELVLPLPSPSVTGNLMILNRALGNVVSKVIIDRIEVRKMP